MNGFITKTIGMCVVVVTTTVLIGCSGTPRRADPCWFERYSAVARANVEQPFVTQASNGHVLDQTIWNWMFKNDEKGRPTAELNADGRNHLTYLIRRRPMPDCRVYVQTAHDVPLDADLIHERAKLNGDRVVTVQNFLTAQMHGRQAIPFDVRVHDPAPVGLPAVNAISTRQAVGDLFKTPTRTYVPRTTGGSTGTGGGSTGGSQ